MMAETCADASVLVTCPMCLNVFDSPRSLPCNHCFCLKCIKNYCKDKVPASRPLCPLCKQNFEVPSSGVDDLPRNNHLERLVDCRKSSHWLHSGDKNVDSVEAKALSRRLSGIYCNKHSDRLTTTHCFNCQENLCSSCSDTCHKNHTLKSIETLAAELKRQIEADIKDVLSRTTDIRSEAERLKTEREKLIEDLGAQVTVVKQKGEELKFMIDRKVEELMQELENIKRDSLNSAQAAESRLQQASDTAHSYCEYSKEIQTQGRPHDVVRYADAIHAQATDLLENEVKYADYTAPCVMFVPTDVEQMSTQQLLGYISTPLSSSGLSFC